MFAYLERTQLMVFLQMSRVSVWEGGWADTYLMCVKRWANKCLECLYVIEDVKYSGPIRSLNCFLTNYMKLITTVHMKGLNKLLVIHIIYIHPSYLRLILLNNFIFTRLPLAPLISWITCRGFKFNT